MWHEITNAYVTPKEIKFALFLHSLEMMIHLQIQAFLLIISQHTAVNWKRNGWRCTCAAEREIPTNVKVLRFIYPNTDTEICSSTQKKAVEEKFRGQEVVKKEHYFSLGSRPSLVYCQQMSPIRSCTLALAMVTTVMGCSLSWLVCSGR